MTKLRRIRAHLAFCAACGIVAFLQLGAVARARAQDTGALAKAAQNPVSDTISLPFQNNILFGVGPGDDTANVLNIQPVIPLQAGQWNLINRTIMPLIYLPDLTDGLPELPEGIDSTSKFGLGDINHTVYLSPAQPGKVIWGIGPSLTLRTATDKELGSEKWSAGPAAVALAMPKSFVVGSLVRQLWSFAGADERKNVSQLLIQPFVNYNRPGGWYLVSAPIITANWKGKSGQRWTVPVGGGMGKIFHIGKQPINAQFQSFYNVEKPKNGPEWSLRFQLQFLFPK